jgi:uncharacterized protein with PQ loop repeat
MIDFTDPVLRSSVRGKETVAKVTNKFSFFLIIVVLVCFILWLIYALQTAQIDTKTNSNNTIQVDEHINAIKIDGRLQPIQKTEE